MASLTFQKQELRHKIRLAIAARVHNRLSPTEARALCVDLAALAASRMTLPELREWSDRLQRLEGDNAS